MNGRLSYFAITFIVVVLGLSCENKPSGTQYDSPQQGTIHISVDESFEPVISDEIKVYQSTYPAAHIIATYKSQADCFKDLQNDSARMIITAQGLTDAQSHDLENAWHFRPNWDVIAYDAVAVIVNRASKDSLFTLKKLQRILSDSASKEDVVVDGNHATSTVKYLLDTVLKGRPFSANVKAAGGSKAVIDYVSKNTDAIGFVGLSYVGNEDDPEQLADAKKIKMALVECKPCGDGYFSKPSQQTIVDAQYPMVRPLFYIIKENSTGLGTGFVNFLSLERGQLIFRRSYLVPAKMNFSIRKSDY